MDGPEPIAIFLERYSARVARWRADIHLDLPTETERRERLAAGKPWIDEAALDPDPAQVHTFLAELLEDLSASSTSNRATLDRLRAAVKDRSLSGSAFLRAILDRDGTAVDRLAERLAVPTQILHFLGLFLARPFYAAAAEGLDPKLVGIETTTSDCPACGQEPALALLMPEDGQRRLWCRVCGFEWPVRRLLCLFCGIMDSSSLGYFSLEGLVGRRVNYCRKCRRYIKTIDLRALADAGGPGHRDREDLLTGELDLAAAREGFVSMAAEGAPTEWRRSGLGSDRQRGGPS